MKFIFRGQQLYKCAGCGHGFLDKIYTRGFKPQRCQYCVSKPKDKRYRQRRPAEVAYELYLIRMMKMFKDSTELDEIPPTFHNPTAN